MVPLGGRGNKATLRVFLERLEAAGYDRKAALLTVKANFGDAFKPALVSKTLSKVFGQAYWHFTRGPLVGRFYLTEAPPEQALPSAPVQPKATVKADESATRQARAPRRSCFRPGGTYGPAPSAPTRLPQSRSPPPKRVSWAALPSTAKRRRSWQQESEVRTDEARFKYVETPHLVPKRSCLKPGAGGRAPAAPKVRVGSVSPPPKRVSWAALPSAPVRVWPWQSATGSDAEVQKRALWWSGDLYRRNLEEVFAGVSIEKSQD